MKSALFFCLVLCSAPVQADFSYRSTVRAAPGQARETMVALHGNRMVRKGAARTEIIDLDKRAITTIDRNKRTWSVMTFGQFRKALSATAPAIVAASPSLDISAGIRATGRTRTIEGYPTKEFVVNMSTSAPGLAFDVHLWVTPQVDGYSAVRDFYRALAKDFDWLPSATALEDRSGITRLAGRLMSQSGMIDGTPIETDITARAAGNTGAASEITIENSGFSAAPADPALFDIPAGFTETPPSPSVR